MVTRRRILQAAAALPLAGNFPASATGSPQLTCAPLAGHFSNTTVRLWLQASAPCAATIAFWPAQAPEGEARKHEILLSDAHDCSAIADLAGLSPATRYRYTILLDGKPTGLMRRFHTAPAPASAPAPFRVYLGSCAYTEAMSPNGNPYGDEFHIFDSIASQIQADTLPHFMLWLGDNLYFRPRGKFLGEADFDSVERMAARYREVREKTMFQNLFAATHHYAIWDDHDYGPNDSDKTFRFKADALRLFRQYWPNPAMGSRDLPGTWTSFVHQDAEFFFLDDRYNRDNEKAPASADKAMFGPAQIDWLKASLARSKATFKLVCNGSQWLSEDENGHHSGWHNYRAERDQFLAWLAREKVSGLLFLSGDRHNTQVFRLKFLSGDRHNTQVFRLKQEGAPVIYEFSCSPLTSRLSKLSRKDRANPRLVAELAVEQRNYGTLEFTGAGATRRIVASCHDAGGKPLWQRTLARAGPDAHGEPVTA